MTKAISYVQEGDNLDWTNNTGADVGYRDIVVLGTRIYIAGEDIKNGATGTLLTEDGWELLAVNDQAFKIGDPVYFDVAAGKVTKVFAGAAGINVPAGTVIQDKAAAGTTAIVDISDPELPVSIVTVVGAAGGNVRGDVASLAGGVAVVLEVIAENALGQAAVTGVYTLKAETDAAFTKGDKLYWDPVAKELTKTKAAGTIPAGVATADKLLATASASILINVFDIEPVV